jgi:DNA-binding cell septation regulator SpoVG
MTEDATARAHRPGAGGMSAIEVLAIRALDGKTTVKAFVDLRVGAIALKGYKIVQQDGQKAWLAMPSVKTERAWNNVVEITSQDLRQRMTDVVLEAWGKHNSNAPTRASDDDGVPW